MDLASITKVNVLVEYIVYENSVSNFLITTCAN